MDRRSIYELVDSERERQNAQWADECHEHLTWVAILAEEVGEVAWAVLNRQAGDYRSELVHVAAVAVAALEELFEELVNS